MEIMAAAMPGISRSSLGRSFMQFAYHENQLRNSFFLFYQHALGYCLAQFRNLLIGETGRFPSFAPRLRVPSETELHR